jgi:hypothetical protein
MTTMSLSVIAIMALKSTCLAAAHTMISSWPKSRPLSLAP